MTHVIHTGDTHIGYRQYHRPERRQDFLDAFRQVIDDAIDTDVDAVVHAGDLFHDRQPELQDILGTLSVLRTLADHDIPFLAVVGNHEAKRNEQWLDLFESLGLAVRLGRSPHIIDDTAFYGMDYVPRSQRDALTYEFEPHDAETTALVAHGLFKPFEYGDWDAREVLSESSVDFDAMLLGDNHTPGRKEIVGTWVTYCGSTERASAAEREARGYNIVEFDEQGAHISRRRLQTREFVFVDVTLGPGEGTERVTERIGQHDLTDRVCIVTIDGEGDAITTASIESFADERGALVARVTDRREREEETTTEVTFADPDEAVRERVRDLGLSAAARDIDETVRASKIADANVKDEVQRRVQDLLDNEDAFAPSSKPERTESTDDKEQQQQQQPTETDTVVSAESGGEATDDGTGQSTMGEFQ